MPVLGYTEADRIRDNAMAHSLGKVEGQMELALGRLNVVEAKVADVEKKTWTHSGVVGVVSIIAGYVGTHVNKLFS